MEQGWVYVLVNSCMPGITKVGRTTRAPHDRAAELSGVTGVATPFIVAYEQAFADCCAAEQAVHDELDRRSLRVHAKREFFTCPPAEIVRLLLQVGQAQAGEAGAVIPACNPPLESGEALLAAGDRALRGMGDVSQDTGEAVRCYKLAATRGAVEAHDRLGRIYLQLFARRRDQASRRRALATLKEGVRRGDAFCYPVMAEVFALEHHLGNVAKSWALFFAAADPACARFATAACRYVSQCLELRVAPAHLPVLRAAGDAMMRALLAEMELVRRDPAERRRVAGCLRWVCENAPVALASVPRPAAERARRAWTAPASLAVA